MEFLLSKGLTRRWIVGNSVVSVTTSGTYIDYDKICENCLPLHNRTKMGNDLSADSSLFAKRRKSREKILGDLTIKTDKNDDKVTMETAIKPVGDTPKNDEKHVTTERSKTPELRDSPVSPLDGQKTRRSDRGTTGEIIGLSLLVYLLTLCLRACLFVFIK